MNKLMIIKKGLTSYQIKVIALILMTIDHFGALGSDIPLFGGNNVFLRQIGRISAPLFLYMITESIKYTNSKTKFIIRLYLAGLFTGLLTILINFYTGSKFGIFHNSNNIFFTFFFIALYIYLFECIGKGIADKKVKQIILSITLIITTFLLPIILYMVLKKLMIINFSLEQKLLFDNMFYSLLPFPLNVEYSIMFVFIGVLMYFVKTKKLKCMVFLSFCILCYTGTSLYRYIDSYYVFTSFFAPNQYLMVFALPFMLLYNEKRGKKQKLFFYVYYPLHRCIIIIINSFFL